MKKNLLGLAMLLTTLTSVTAQDTLTKNKVELTPYIATGISVPNTTDVSNASYMSAEVGVMIENFAFAGVIGVNNLNSFESIQGYWYEGKVSFAFPMGVVDGYVMTGLGSYIDTKGSLFIEYGGGIMKSFGNLGTFVQVSSWDGVMYVTPGLSYSF